MKISENGHILFFMHLLTAELFLTGVLCVENRKYDRLKTYYHILRQENRYLKKSRREMLRQQKKFRFLRHEMKNDYILEMGYLEKKLYGQLKEHYREKTGYFGNENNLIHTGNIGMDAILNHKLEAAAEEQIRIDVQHQLTSCVKIGSRDLNMILGNLLDNAMEAVRRLKPADRKIALHIWTDASALFLEISNPYSAACKKTQREIIRPKNLTATFTGRGCQG